MSRRPAMLVFLGCVAARVITPCDEPACSDSRCQWNTGAGRCEFKDKLARECAKTIPGIPGIQDCPRFCFLTYEKRATYKYCQAKLSPSCSTLPRDLCGEPYRCEWAGSYCKDQRWTPCDDAMCSDSRCQLNNGKCEFKTKIERECAMILDPSYQNCPKYCSVVRNPYNYCKAESSPSCSYLPRELCGELHRCKWTGSVCKDQGWSPCDEPECSDSRCQLNNGKCEFKTKIGRECAMRPPSWKCATTYCNYVQTATYNYCQAKSSLSCSDLPEKLCGEPYRCKWNDGQCKDLPWTPCDDPKCTDSRCQLNNGKCEFKTEIERECAMIFDPSYQNCPKYCNFVRNTKHKYCKAKSNLSCSDLSREPCVKLHRCKWTFGLCEDQRWTPCDEPGCTDSRCQLNNGKCEFKNEIGRECAEVLYPSRSSCPSFCAYSDPGDLREDAYRYCTERLYVSCLDLPDHLCKARGCKWHCSQTITYGDQEGDNIDQRLDLGPSDSSSFLAFLLPALLIPFACVVVVIYYYYVRPGCVGRRAAIDVVQTNPAGDSVTGAAEAVLPPPVCGIPVNEYPQYHPPMYARPMPLAAPQPSCPPA